MANFTKQYKLILPEPGATNWGTALNSNFLKIDNNMIEFDNRLVSFQTLLGQIGHITFNPAYNYCKLKNIDTYDASSWFIDLGTVSVAQTETENLNDRLEDTFTPNPEYTDMEVLQLDNLKDYQGYYIFEDWQAYGGAELSDDDKLKVPAPWNETWLQGEIMVKVTAVVDNERKSNFIHFPQMLGGYYIPSEMTIDDNGNSSSNASVGYWNFKWSRFTPSNAGKEYGYKFRFPIPYCTSGIFNGKIGEDPWKKTDTNIYYMHLPNITASDPFPSIDCTFFELTSNKWTKCEIGYALLYDQDIEKPTWRLDLTPDIDISSKTIHCMIKYYKPDTSWFNVELDSE